MMDNEEDKTPHPRVNEEALANQSAGQPNNQQEPSTTTDSAKAAPGPAIPTQEETAQMAERVRHGLQIAKAELDNGLLPDLQALYDLLPEEFSRLTGLLVERRGLLKEWAERVEYWRNERNTLKERNCLNSYLAHKRGLEEVQHFEAIEPLKMRLGEVISQVRELKTRQDIDSLRSQCEMTR